MHSENVKCNLTIRTLKNVLTMCKASPWVFVPEQVGAAGPSLSTGHGDLGGWAGAQGGLPAEALGWEVRGAQLGRHPAEALGWEVHRAQLGRHPADGVGPS